MVRVKNVREVADDGLALIRGFVLQFRNQIQHLFDRFIDVIFLTVSASIRTLVADPVVVFVIVFQRIIPKQDPELFGAFWAVDATDKGAQLGGILAALAITMDVLGRSDSSSPSQGPSKRFGAVQVLSDPASFRDRDSRPHNQFPVVVDGMPRIWHTIVLYQAPKLIYTL